MLNALWGETVIKVKMCQSLQNSNEMRCNNLMLNFTHTNHSSYALCQILEIKVREKIFSEKITKDVLMPKICFSVPTLIMFMSKYQLMMKT